MGEHLDYRDWLVGYVNNGREDYGPMLRELSRKEFYSLVKYDEDRAADGVALRETWAETVGYRGDTAWGPCTVLEVLIGIALRIEFQLFGSRWMDEWQAPEIFWEMARNLGLEKYAGDLSEQKYDEISLICDKFVERLYKRHGEGNIFGPQNTEKDVRKMNIWAQMGLFMREKWPI